MKKPSVYQASHAISRVAGRYDYGGGHDRSIDRLHDWMGLDCSSSVSLALYRAGLFGKRTWSLSAKDFGSWGLPGPGKRFTLWYKGGTSRDHVFLVFHGQRKGYRRFDTSPWGFGGSGPRIRKTWRPTTGFKPRHWPGM